MRTSPSWTHRRDWPAAAGAAALLAAVYFAAGKLGLSMAFVNASATAVWPPTGIAIAALLVFGSRLWPGIALGAFLVNATTAGTALTSLGISAGNTFEALLAVWLLRRWSNGTGTFDTLQGVFRFALLAGAAATAVSATIGVASLALGGYARWADFGSIWLTWWLGDAAGALIVAPPLVLTLSGGRPPAGSHGPRGLIERACLAAALAATALVVFGGWLPTTVKTYPLEFLCTLTLMWGALRFGPRAASTCTLILAGLAVYGTLNGFGPYAAYTPNAALLLLQSYMAATSVTVLALAAVVSRGHVSESGLMDFVENAPIGMHWVGPDGTILWANKTELDLLGYARTEYIGRPMADFYDDPEAIEDVLARLNRGETLTDYTARLRCRDGSFKDILISSNVQWAGERFVHTRCFTRDITDYKAAQELREKAKSLASHNEELRLFASTAAHELQEPVRKLITFSELLKAHAAKGNGHGLDAKGGDYLDRMVAAASRMQRLIEGLLSLARVTTQARPLEPVDLEATVREVVADLGPELAKSGGKVEVDALPIVMADSLQMRQLFTNLLNNALKFRRLDTAPIVSVSGRRSEAGFLEVRVQDNGIGFEEKYLERLFKPFQRLHSRGEYEGTGMGLAICERIVLRHSGTITAEGIPGRGATFIVVLPAMTASMRLAPADPR